MTKPIFQNEMAFHKLSMIQKANLFPSLDLRDGHGFKGQLADLKSVVNYFRSFCTAQKAIHAGHNHTHNTLLLEM